MSACGYVDVCTGAAKARDAESPGAGVTGVCELPAWVLGTKFWTFERASSALNQ